jgi:methyltransferase-like protein
MCREMLAPQGVGFVSYNAYPGGHIRQMTREIMLYHTRALSEPHEKIQQSIAIMTFLANGANQGKLYQKMYDAELDTLRDRNPENIYHDDLSDANQPFYLYQFVENIGRHSLKYISDVQYFSTRDLTYPPDVIKALDSMGDDVVMREQYLDFLNCRRFRQSLICHHEVDLDRRPRVEMLEKLRMASRVKPTSEQPELASKKSEEFVGPKVENIEIDHSLTKAALSYLGQLWPRSASLNEIISEAKQLLSKESGSQWVVNDNDEAILREIFMRIFGSGLIEFRTFEPRYADSVSDRPMVSPLARWQAERGETVFNLRYESLNIEDQLGLKLISVLDGTRDRDEILSEMMRFVRSPELRADDAERQKLEGELPQALDKKLAEMAYLALLVE